MADGPHPLLQVTLRVDSSYDEPELDRCLHSTSVGLMTPTAAAALLRAVADELAPKKEATRG